MKKMTLQDLKDLFMPQADPIKGDPNLHTAATKKKHIHKHSLSKGQEKHAFYLATQPKKQPKKEER